MRVEDSYNIYGDYSYLVRYLENLSIHMFTLNNIDYNNDFI